MTKLGSAYGSKSSHQTTAQAAAASQRVTQDEGEQQVSYWGTLGQGQASLTV